MFRLNRTKKGSFTSMHFSPREVLWWAFQWGAEAEIIEPGWLREEAKKTAEEMVGRYK